MVALRVVLSAAAMAGPSESSPAGTKAELKVVLKAAPWAGALAEHLVDSWAGSSAAGSVVLWADCWAVVRVVS